MSELFLVAHVINAQSPDTAIVELEVATEIAGDWFNNEGHQIWPFWTQPLDIDLPAIPPGWLDHLATKAITFATKRQPARDLTALLGLTTKPFLVAPIIRRI